MDEETLTQIEEWLVDKIEVLKSSPIGTNVGSISFMGFQKFYPSQTLGQDLVIDTAKEMNASKIKTFELILNYVRSQKDFSNELE